MPRTAGSDDRDWEFLDKLIVLVDDIKTLVEDIKDESDEPEVLHSALKIEAAALIIQQRTVCYRPRLRELKELVSALRKQIADLKQKARLPPSGDEP